MKELLKPVGIVGIVIIIQSFLMYFLQIFMSHSLAIEEFGLFNVALSIFWILSVVLTAGIEKSAVKFIAENKDKTKKIISNFIYIEIIFSLIVSLILFSYAISTKELSMLLILIAIMLPFSSLTSVFYGFFQGFELIKKFASLVLFDTFSKVILSIFLVIIGFGLFGAVFGFVIGSIIIFFLCFYLLRKKVYFTKINKKLVKKIIFFSFPTSLSIIAFTFLVRSDIVLLKFFNLSNELIGIYSGSAILSRFVYYITAALTIVLLPKISSNKQINFKRLFFSLFLFYGAGIVFTSLFSKQILIILYPNHFAAMHLVLIFLVIAMSIISIDWVIATIFIGKGELKKALYPVVLGIILYLFASFYFIPKYSIFGIVSLLITIPLLVLLGYIIVYAKDIFRK